LRELQRERAAVQEEVANVPYQEDVRIFHVAEKKSLSHCEHSMFPENEVKMLFLWLFTT